MNPVKCPSLICLKIYDNRIECSLARIASIAPCSRGITSTLNGTSVFCRRIGIIPIRICCRPMRTTSQRDCPACKSSS
jgi:hypothetical protein